MFQVFLLIVIGQAGMVATLADERIRHDAAGNLVSREPLTPEPPIVIGEDRIMLGRLGDGSILGAGVNLVPGDAIQWYFDGTRLDGETNQTLTIDALLASDLGRYWALVSNELGTTQSATIRLATVHDQILAWGSDKLFQTGVPEGLNQVAGDLSAQSAEVVALSSSYNHTLALMSDGTVQGWGANGSGQLDPPPDLADAVVVAAGWNHSLALRRTGTLVAWGANDEGQGTTPDDLQFRVAAIAAGDRFNLAVTKDGKVRAWGAPSFGKTAVPANLVNVVAVAAGANHGLALRADGSVIGWGRNSAGQTDIPAGLTQVVAIAAGGNHSLALTSAGRVVTWGDSPGPVRLHSTGPSDVVAIAAGVSHDLALRSDGTIVAWGDNSDGQATAPPGLKDVVAVAAGYAHSVALTGQPSWLTRPVIVSTTLPLAVAGQPYHHAIIVKNGADSYQAKGLPPGLSMDPATGVVTGNPTEVGTFDVRLVVSNTSGTVTNEFQLVSAVPQIALFNEPKIVAYLENPFQLQTQAAYAQRYDASGLPPGLGVDKATGLVHGEPSEVGLFSVLLTAANDYTSASLPVMIDVRQIAVWGSSGDSLPAVPSGLDSVISIAAGGRHNIALTDDGDIVAWGYAGQSRLSIPAGLSNVVAISAGDAHTLALKNDGTVVAWGLDSSGRLDLPKGLNNVVGIGAGEAHSLALRSDGTVVAWGANRYGQGAVPDGLHSIVAIAAGADHNLAITEEGTVIAWGNSSHGKTAVPAGLDRVISVSAGLRHSLALREDGSVVGWGNNTYDQINPPRGATNVVAIAAGYYHSLALRDDGVALLWGSNQAGKVDPPVDVTHFLAVAGGESHSLGLVGPAELPREPVLIGPRRIVGTVGHSFHSRMTVLNRPAEYSAEGLPPGLALDPATGVIRGVPSEGGTFHVRLTTVNGDGSSTSELRLTILAPAPVILSDLAPQVVYLGNPFSYQIEANNNPSGFVAEGLPAGLGIDGRTGRISGTPQLAGVHSVLMWATNLYASSSALLPLRVLPVAVWGKSLPQDTPPEVTDVVSISAGDSFLLALQSDGTVAAWGSSVSGRISVPTWLTGVVAISAGYSHSLALREDGSVVAWGSNAYGKATIPTGATNVVAVAAGGSHSLALRADRSIIGWGRSSNGRTQAPDGLSAVVAIAAGSDHSVALQADGHVAAWGANAAGQAEVPDELDGVLAIAAGEFHSLAMLADGSVAAWGATSEQQAVIPPGLPPFAGIASGWDHNLGLRADGTVVAWGDTDSGKSTVPSGLVNVVAVAAGSEFSAALLAAGPLCFTPEVVRAPTNLQQCAGQTVHLSVLARGTAPLFYQWFKDGVALPESAHALLHIENLQPADAGYYSVLVSNFHGQVTSEAARVDVLPVIPLTIAPDSLRWEGGFSFQLQGEPLGKVILQWSTDLTIWNELLAGTLDEEGRMDVTDANTEAPKARYYRAVLDLD